MLTRLTIPFLFLFSVIGCGGKSMRDEAHGGSETGGNETGGSSPSDPTGGHSGSNGKGGSATTTGGTSSATGGTGVGAAGATSSGSAGDAPAGMGGAIDAGAAGSTVGGEGGTGAGGSGVGVCSTDEDCRVSDDCCACVALGPDEVTPSCPLDCDESRCALEHGSAAMLLPSCSAGRCVLNRSCNARPVACDGAPPRCAAGSVPVVSESCWTGACMPVTECADVTSCEVCDESGTDCVVKTIGLGPGSFHCVLPPPNCAGSCACMQVCQPFEMCIDEEPLTCYFDCITC